MKEELEPLVGKWYTDVDDGQTFVVTVLDEDRGVVEVRYEDGEIEELDLAEWSDLDLERTEPPEDWPADTDADLEDAEPGLEEGTAAWRRGSRPARPRPGKTWDDDDEDEDDEDQELEDWGEESEED